MSPKHLAQLIKAFSFVSLLRMQFSLYEPQNFLAKI